MQETTISTISRLILDDLQLLIEKLPEMDPYDEADYELFSVVQYLKERIHNLYNPMLGIKENLNDLRSVAHF